MPTADACHVVGPYSPFRGDVPCLAAPGLMKKTRAVCFACGQNVCTNCSRRRVWYRLGRGRRRRICRNCIDDDQKTV